MRAGLLSRFMGALGMIVGGLLILPVLPGGQSTVQIFWVAALGVLILGRWPNGRGPAWDSGEADPWPTAQQRAQEMAEARAAREEEFSVDDEDEDGSPRTAVSAGRRPGLEDLGTNGDGAAERRQSPQHPRSKKRKRKRR